MSLTKPRGVLVLKSTVASGKELNLAPIVIDEITVLGSRCGQFAPALRLLENNKIDIYVDYEETSEYEPGIILDQKILEDGDKVNPNVDSKIRFTVSTPIVTLS